MVLFITLKCMWTQSFIGSNSSRDSMNTIGLKVERIMSSFYTTHRSVLEEAGNSLATILGAQDWSTMALQEQELSLPPADGKCIRHSISCPWLDWALTHPFRITDDSWLELSAEQLDEMVYAATGNPPPPQVGPLASCLVPNHHQQNCSTQPVARRTLHWI